MRPALVCVLVWVAACSRESVGEREGIVRECEHLTMIPRRPSVSQRSFGAQNGNLVELEILPGRYGVNFRAGTLCGVWEPDGKIVRDPPGACARGRYEVFHVDDYTVDCMPLERGAK